jgi:hypothetical protein
MKLATLAILAVVALGPCALSAGADTTYTYTGNPFNVFPPSWSGEACPPVCGVSGSFTLAAPLPANLYLDLIDLPGTSGADPNIHLLSTSFSDGGGVWNPENSLITNFRISTDQFGVITNWSIAFDLYAYWYNLDTLGPGFGVPEDLSFLPGAGGKSSIKFNPGTWSVTDPPAQGVPEPSTLLLLSAGASFVFAFRRMARSS